MIIAKSIYSMVRDVTRLLRRTYQGLSSPVHEDIDTAACEGALCHGLVDLAIAHLTIGDIPACLAGELFNSLISFKTARCVRHCRRSVMHPWTFRLGRSCTRGPRRICGGACGLHCWTMGHWLAASPTATYVFHARLTKRETHLLNLCDVVIRGINVPADPVTDAIGAREINDADGSRLAPTSLLRACVQLSRTGSDAIGSDALSSQQPSMGRNSYRGDVVLEPLPEHTEGAEFPRPPGRLGPIHLCPLVMVCLPI